MVHNFAFFLNVNIDTLATRPVVLIKVMISSWLSWMQSNLFILWVEGRCAVASKAAHNRTKSWETDSSGKFGMERLTDLKDQYVWCWIRGATFWAFFKNHEATLLNASILHQLTLKRPSDPKKNWRRNFPKPKTSNFGPILAYVQKKAHLAILKLPAGALTVPNFWYWA